MSDEVIDALLVKLGIVVDQASFTQGTSAVNGLDNAINRAARERGRTGIDKFGKNMAEFGQNARGLEQTVDKFDKTVARTPRTVGVLQSRLGSATQQMSAFRKETQAAVSLLSRGAGSAGLGPLSGSMFAMLAGGGPMSLAIAGIGGLAANAYSYAGNAVDTNISARSNDVSMSDYYALNKYGQARTGKEGVGDQMFRSALAIRQSVSSGQGVPNTPAIIMHGGNPQALANPSFSTKQMLEEEIRQISSAKTQIDKIVLSKAFGMDEYGMDVASSGVDSVRSGMDSYRKGAPSEDDNDAGRKFKKSMADLSTDFDNLSNKLGLEVIPSLDGFVKKVDSFFFSKDGGASKYMDAGRELLNGNWKAAAKKFGEAEESTPVINQDQMSWIESTASSVTDSVKGVVKQKYDAVSAGAQDWLASHDSRIAQKKDGYMKYFMDNGYTREQAAGVVGNLIGESRLDPQAVGDGGDAYGLAQWHEPRRRDFKEFFGRDMKGSSEQDQLDFILYELQNKEKSAGDALAKTKTSSEAADVFRRLYERPAENPENAKYRMRIAEELHEGLPNLPPLAVRSDQASGHSVLPEAGAPSLSSQDSRPGQPVRGPVLPGDVPETYNMVVNPPAPPSIDLTQSQQSAEPGNVIHIDARGSTDPHHVTSEAIRAVNDQLQGHMTVVQSHLSTDLDQ